MFSSSMRRVARPPTVTLPTPTARPSSAVFTACSNSVVAPRTQQRRYSSSKPPVPPNDGSRGIDASSQAPAKSVNPSNTEKREGKAGKRRGKDSNGNKLKNEAFLNLPSVPPTEHLQPLDIQVASFFSIHRPMSITTSIPPSSNQDAFSSIFEQKKQSNTRPNDVIYTLSSALNAIEGGSPKRRQRSSAGDRDLKAAVTQASSSNADPNMLELDGISVEQMRSSIQEFAKTLRPFNPPPAPVPMGENKGSKSAQESDFELAASQEQNYSSFFTPRESSYSSSYTDPFGRVEDLEAPSGAEEGKIIDESGAQRRPVRFLERMRQRQLRWNRFRQQQQQQHERTIHAISVKRQRKLKMKRHKRKKFLRRTRTLRHKLNKA